MNSNTRKLYVQKRTQELDDLLEQWESYRLTARDPSEKLRSEHEIARIKKLLSDYQNENAHGIETTEDSANPLVSPEERIRKVNRRWIAGIFIFLTLLLIGFFLFEKYSQVSPDYSKYLMYLAQGDSLVKKTNYVNAKVAYKNALKWNPGDSIATKKLDLIKKADKLISEKKYGEAKKLFKIIITLPPSFGLSPEALSLVANDDNQNSNTITITLTWSGQTLQLKINGGVPFTNEGKDPYKIEGINCQGCIKWGKEGKAYTASITGENVKTLNIKLTDSRGYSSIQKIPMRPTTGRSENKPDNHTSNTSASSSEVEERLNTFVTAANTNYMEGKFTDAQRNYQAALNLKPGIDSVLKRLAECEKKIAELELADAKDIPRISIKGGSFKMGSQRGNLDEKPEHEVRIHPFSLGKTEVTLAQYRRFCKYKNRAMQPEPTGGWIDNNPVVNVSWDDAKAYCAWVNGRLPTEAEWEYAARAAGNSPTTYSGSEDVDKVAIYKNNSGGKPTKVGQKMPNTLGLYDMTGNIFEWCNDWYSPKYYAASEKDNPQGPSSGSEKVLRGGGFNSVTYSRQDGNQLRVSYRNSKEVLAHETDIGFRVAWDN